MAWIFSKRNCLYFAIACSFVILILSVIESTLLGDYFGEYLTAKAQSRNVSLKLNNSRLSLGGMKSGNVAVAVVNGKVPLVWDFEDAFVSPNWLSVVSLHPSADVRAASYGGKISATILSNLLGDRLLGSIQLKDLQLSKHPQLALLGINSGVVSFEGKDLEIHGNTIISGSFSLDIGGLNRVEGGLSSKLLRFPLPIPPIQNFNLHLTGSLDKDVINVSRIESTSGLGSIVGRITIYIARQNSPVQNSRVQRPSAKIPPKISAHMELDLSQEGLHHIGPYLALAGGKGLRPGQHKFSIELSGIIPFPSIKIS